MLKSMIKKLIKTTVLLLLIMHFSLIAQMPAFKKCRSDFSIKVRDCTTDLNIISLSVMPDEVINITVIDSQYFKDYSIESNNGILTKTEEALWNWKAPKEPDIYPIKVSKTGSNSSIIINAIVLVPYDSLKKGYLNGYRIGEYPTIPLKQLAIYELPGGFIEVTEENKDVLISPHFRLGELLSKQDSDYPKYLVLRTRLLLKLEHILEKVNEKGYVCSNFYIMSGYRTPFYNKAIGNVKYSRHVWGGAADIFIDENPVDGVMDDLNKDGLNNYKDAEIIYDIIDEMYGHSWYEPFVGGLGLYKKTKSHGPFVHVDVRGFRARWGD